MPLPLLLCTRMVAYASGNGTEVRRQLREVRYIGKKAAHGHGKVIKIDVEHCEQDNSLTMDGLAMRWLPQAGGVRLVRPRPPECLGEPNLCTNPRGCGCVPDSKTPNDRAEPPQGAEEMQR